jgi:hypothetical protein
MARRGVLLLTIRDRCAGYVRAMRRLRAGDAADDGMRTASVILYAF